MNGLIRNYQECDSPKTAVLCRKPSQREILTERKENLELQLKEVEAALDFFDKNPSFEQGLDILSKALR